ncbi:hypothetical protein [Pseudidiomarina mangrovi]|uniref:hypothetical protein n=1 Tax=Pseudidiomarina mangrovi TaxID=2487133 RepID=UPI00196AE93E|nr:hypothetical protein [Pseudidiomarina mangrovi]
MRIMTWLLMSLCVLLVPTANAGEEPDLHPQLEFFRPYLDTYWIGDLSEPGSDQAKIDRAHWQRALNGNAIKTIHSLNDGEYGGESIIFWDEQKQTLAYYYFTTAGFYTHGTMTFHADTNVLEAYEQVENNANGITAVKSTSQFDINAATLTSSSQYLKNDEWVSGHSAVYRLSGPLDIIFH